MRRWIEARGLKSYARVYAGAGTRPMVIHPWSSPGSYPIVIRREIDRVIDTAIPGGIHDVFVVCLDSEAETRDAGEVLPPQLFGIDVVVDVDRVASNVAPEFLEELTPQPASP